MSTNGAHPQTARLSIDGRDVDYRLRKGGANSRLRIRVGTAGVEVLQPISRRQKDVEEFMQAHGAWILDQLARIERLRSARRVTPRPAGEFLFRGNPTLVSVDAAPRWKGSNRVLWNGSGLVVSRGWKAQTTLAQTLENWLRRQARESIEPLVASFAAKVGVAPGRVYIMDQRTKWGNCSSLQNLSFNWRTVMAPDEVLRYLVAHECVHLAVPDHSRKFWLTVRSVCPESERARQWLLTNGDRLLVDLNDLVGVAPAGSRPLTARP